jgi:hypothetical protein
MATLVSARTLPDALTVKKGNDMWRWAWVFIGLCFGSGCADRTPVTQDSAVPSSKDVVAKEMAAASDNPTEVLDRAIAALGGGSARKKLRTCKITTRWVVAIPAAVRGMGGDTTLIEDCFCYPDKWRRTVHRSSDDKEVMLFVLNGENYWARTGGKKVQAMPLPPMNARKPAILITIDNLAALRESKDQIIIGAEEEVAGKTLIPLTTMVSGHPRSTTYFDRSTSLIAKETKCSLPRVQDPPETWKKRGPAEMETTYGDYRSFEGVMLPTRMVMSQAGKTVLEVSVLEVEFPSKFDAHVFEKPENE